ncbi:MAG: AAA family ATPase [Blastocatellia bacterium]|nr:AAA family ATPase [Blastocatellia bacterium]
MEFLYNPDSMPEHEIKATFVAREWIIDELISTIKRQPDGAGVQHLLIIAPRGMGKTTVLLMVKFAIKDRGLAKRWQAVKFPEESYGIYDLADFWMEVLALIAADTDDEDLLRRAEQLKAENPDSEDLQEAALALIKDWRRENKKRLLLLVDNLDIILEQINDERDNARLRDVLMNDGTMMMIGCAVSFFHEARAYDQPLYNFFKTYDLSGLRFEQMQGLLRKRAELDRRENFEEKLKANAARLRTLEYFTGGNPRLVLMLYRVITQSDISDVRQGLEKLLDEVTPYFKAKVESLPPQQRKILDHIARVSGKTNEGLTPTEIAGAARLTANQVSAQLKRLSEMGYVRAANLRGRSSYYTLSEPLYAIWHQMRSGRNARERMQWLINFLKAWYDAEEMGAEINRLEARFHNFLSLGRMVEARDALEHRRYLVEALAEILDSSAEAITEAIGDSYVRASTIEKIIRSYLNDVNTLTKELLTDIRLESLSDEILSALHEVGCISKKEISRATASPSPLLETDQQQGVAVALGLGVIALSTGRMSEAVQHLDRVLALNSNLPKAWIARGLALYSLNRYEESIASFDCAQQFKPELYDIWLDRAFVMGNHQFPWDRKRKDVYLPASRWSITELLSRCSSRPLDEVAWQEFVRRYHSTIRANVLKTYYSKAKKEMDRKPQFLEDMIEDLVQTVYIKLIENQSAALNHFVGKHDNSIYQYLGIISINVVRDYFREVMAKKRPKVSFSLDQLLEISGDSPLLGEAISDIDGSPLDEGGAYFTVEDVESALRKVVSSKNRDRDIAIFKMRYYEGLTLDEISEAIGPNMSAVSVGSVLNRIVKRLNPLLTEGPVTDRCKESEAGSNYPTRTALDNSEPEYNCVTTHLTRFAVQLSQGRIDIARRSWNKAVNSAIGLDKEQQWHELASQYLTMVAQSGHLDVVRQLIKESDLEEPLFPLARAIDYLLTDDEALIEKLSPEVRGIVEEVVVKLRQTSQQKGQRKSRARKKSSVKKKPGAGRAKPGSRSRTRKQLR